MIEDDVVIPPYPNGQSLSANYSYGSKTGGIILYKMGDVSVLEAGRIGAYVAGGTDMYYLATSNAIQPIVPSCQTPSVDVPLGKQFSNKFKGVGSTIGEKAFSIQLNNCPAGINSITYRLDPLNTPVDANNGILALDSGGATGVGIKITDNNGSAISLGKTINFLSNVAAGSYTIPLKAAYYKTSDTVVGGSANASMQFTITYQ
ncbi:fimbrial protein [Pseudomonas promysalinigenes]|uniref:fimbrial protein n=1 Tax=Pseudomonas promysalinigenes TaxID=485898 RepID=UPI003FA15DFF